MSNEVNKFVLHFKHTIAVFIIGALSFIVALQWQATINGVITTYIPPESGIWYQLLTSITITIVAIPVIYLLSKLKIVEVQKVEVVNK